VVQCAGLCPSSGSTAISTPTLSATVTFNGTRTVNVTGSDGTTEPITLACLAQ
jgi:hypothetical protein